MNPNSTQQAPTKNQIGSRIGRLGLISGAASLLLCGTAAAFPLIQAVSVAQPRVTGEHSPHGASGGAVMDASGRYTVFVSDAADLVGQAQAGMGTEVYLRDRQAGTTQLISVSSDGIHAGGGNSGAPSISSDGRRIVFESDSNRLVPGDASGFRSIYLRDLDRGTTLRVSPAGSTNGPASNPVVAADGSSVAYEQWVQDATAPGNGFRRVLLKTSLNTGVTELVAGGRNDVDPERPMWSRGLSTVVFHRDLGRPDLISGAVATDLWLRRTGDSAPIAVTLPIRTNGLYFPVFTANATVSDDGSVVAFRTVVQSTNDLDATGVWWMDLASGVPVRISDSATFKFSTVDDLSGPEVSSDGRTVVFQSADTAVPFSPLRIWSVERGLKSLSDWAAIGAPKFDPLRAAEPVLSRDGSRLVYLSDEAHPLAGVTTGGTPRVYVRSLSSGVTRALAQVKDSELLNVQWSDDGVWLGLESELNLATYGDANGESDVFLFPALDPGPTVATSVADVSIPSPKLGNRASLLTSNVQGISDDGTRVVFLTSADDLIPGDVNGSQDAVVRDLRAGTTSALGRESTGGLMPDGSTKPVISGDGRRAAFLSTSRQVVPGDTNTGYKVFVRDLETGTMQLASAPDRQVTGGGWSSSNPMLSRDGKRVLFEYSGPDLAVKTKSPVNLFVRDLETLRTYAATADPEAKFPLLGSVGRGTGRLSADGSTVGFLAVLTPHLFHVNEGTLEQIATDEFIQGTTALELSGDGRRVVLGAKLGSPSVPVLAWYDVAGRSNHVILRAASRTNTISSVAISRDGSHLAYVGNFTPEGASLPAGVLGLFVYDVNGRAFRRIGSESQSIVPDATVDSPSFSADGRFIAFRSRASNLVPGDENGVGDVFVQDLDLGLVTLLSRSPKTGRSGNNLSARPVISADGSRVAFLSFADDLVDGDGNGLEDVFVAEVPQWLRPSVSTVPARGGIEVRWLVPNGVRSLLEWSASLGDGAAWEVIPVDPGIGTDPMGTEVVRSVVPNDRARFIRVRTF